MEAHLIYNYHKYGYSLPFVLLFLLYCYPLFAENIEYSVKIFSIGLWTPQRLARLCDNIYCESVTIHSKEQLRVEFNSTCSYSHGRPLITVSKYNLLHGWNLPLTCDVPTHLEMYETIESYYRFRDEFEEAKKYFKYNSSTYVTSAVRFYYIPSVFKTLQPLRQFANMIKGAAYIQSHCDINSNWKYKIPSNREAYVRKMRELGFRVDGLAKCLHTPNIPEGIVLKKENGTGLSKLEAINHYLFTIAFENTIEPGYVTEKPTDPLAAGSVPIYLGDEGLMKELSPHPKAVIYLADFNYNINKLVEYLNYLINNEAAYEEHRAWRKTFNFTEYLKVRPQYEEHDCKVCKWAVKEITAVAGPHYQISNDHDNYSIPVKPHLFQPHRWNKFTNQHYQRVHEHCKNENNTLLYGESRHNKLATCHHQHLDQKHQHCHRHRLRQRSNACSP